MARSLLMLVLLLGVAGCAGAPRLSESCAGTVVLSKVTLELPERSACAPRVAEPELVAALGAVRQTGGQTRTVGVPRGFLVAVLVLILLVSLA